MDRQKLIKRLKSKGWTSEDITKAFRIMETPERTKTKQFMNKIVYWTALLVTIIGNVFVSVILILFLLTLNSFSLYFIIATIALTFGLLFNLIVNDIENIDPKHHVLAGIFIPAIALINIYIITILTNDVQIAIKIQNPHSPILVSVTYVLAFMIPYIVSSYIEAKTL